MSIKESLGFLWPTSGEVDAFSIVLTSLLTFGFLHDALGISEVRQLPGLLSNIIPPTLPVKEGKNIARSDG